MGFAAISKPEHRLLVDNPAVLQAVVVDRIPTQPLSESVHVKTLLFESVATQSLHHTHQHHRVGHRATIGVIDSVRAGCIIKLHQRRSPCRAQSLLANVAKVGIVQATGGNRVGQSQVGLHTAIEARKLNLHLLARGHNIATQFIIHLGTTTGKKHQCRHQSTDTEVE